MAYINYPFSAILGQDKLKMALILNLINPKIRGVLITGKKGTAKSTAVRALGGLTGKKIITLPLSITEDRLTGSVDIQETMKNGKTVFQPGILTEAHNQILYVDEINLLQECITDIILSVHSSNENHVEREGISNVTVCDFILIGTMNSEEGEVRQHFLDRFGLCVAVETENTPEQRVSIVKARMAFEENPQAFINVYEKEEQKLQEKIGKAIKNLSQIVVTEANRIFIVKKCLEAQVQGHRADIILEETAKAMAAWNNHKDIQQEDIEEAAKYVLLHRRRNMKEPEQKEQEEKQQKPTGQSESQELEESQQFQREEQSTYLHGESNTQGMGEEQAFMMGQSFKTCDFGHAASKQLQKGFGKRTTAKSAGKMGRYIYSVQQNLTGDIALDATIRAAAPYQQTRDKNGLAIAIQKSDIREKVRQRKYANLLVFIVDASGSMGATKRMIETKGAILSLLKDAYVKRDKVCLIAFHGEEAKVWLPPTRSIDRGVRLLETMKVGGRTPLNHGILKGMQVVQSEMKKNPEILPYMIIVTDGKGNVSLNRGKSPRNELYEICEKVRSFSYIDTMILDIERKGATSFGIAKEMAKRMNADYQKIETLKSSSILSAVERIREL